MKRVQCQQAHYVCAETGNTQLPPASVLLNPTFHSPRV